jgi:hypothetical protein
MPYALLFTWALPTHAYSNDGTGEVRVTAHPCQRAVVAAHPERTQNVLLIETVNAWVVTRPA